jgi:hypothetical protein
MRWTHSLWFLLAASMAAVAQVPTTATRVILTQVNTLDGVTTLSFTDSAGVTFYLQMQMYFTIQIPHANSPVVPLPTPALWEAFRPPLPSGPTASLDKTTIANNDGNAILDAALNKWTVVDGVVQMNGSPIGYSSGVAKLVIVNGVLWQQNIALAWYYWNAAAVTWDWRAVPPI